MSNSSEIFNRAKLILGEESMKSLDQARVILFGVGGVGSWCAEGLVRSGLGHLTLVDFDRVSESNINRQLMATTRTIGQVKVEALKGHLLEINPEAEIITLRKLFTDENHEEFDLDSYDYIVDAVDSLKDKASLILRACESKAKFFSSMGAALKVDPTKIQVAEFWNVRGCPLGSALRKKFKRNHTFPAHKFLCVYDEEVLENIGGNRVEEETGPDVGDPQPEDALKINKAVTNGSLAHITAIFGFTLSGLIIKDIYQSCGPGPLTK